MARGPDVVVLTFDNLGEASELEGGTWDGPLGEHPSVTDALPRLLDELDRHALGATFFVEAINCELYPAAVREIAARGHEVGLHGWRHEQWNTLSAERERGALGRGTEAFAALGIEVRGFRPPGGELTERSPALLREAGISWCSPAGGEPAVRDGLTYVPFAWELVDAYHLMERFTTAPVDPALLAERFVNALEAGPALRTVIMHPFLMLDERWFDGVRDVLMRLRTLADTGRARVLSGGGAADLVRLRRGA
jgi:peptidoglycan/xylan/chitin deacetylase (PgdA/CDA1 family)